MKKKFLLLLCIIFAIWSIAITIICLNNNEQNYRPNREIVSKKLKDHFELNQTRRRILKVNMELTLQNDFKQILNSCIYKANDTLNKFKILDSIKGLSLVYSFSGNACDQCIEFGINKLKYFFEDYSNNEKILLLTSDLDPRLKGNYYDKSVFSFCSTKLGLAIEEHHIPFFCLLDKEGRAKMMFIPDKLDPELTDIYLKQVKDRFFME